MWGRVSPLERLSCLSNFSVRIGFSDDALLVRESTILAAVGSVRELAGMAAAVAEYRCAKVRGYGIAVGHVKYIVTPGLEKMGRRLGSSGRESEHV